MFEQFLKDPHALARHRNKPLAEERHRYLAHCIELGMTPLTVRPIASYLLAIADYLRLGDRPGEMISPAEIQAQAARWARRPGHLSRPRRGQGQRNFITYATHWLRFLGRWQTPAVPLLPHAERVAAFATFMRDERGLSPTTVTFRCQTANDFLGRLRKARQTLEAVTPTQIDDILTGKLQTGGWVRVSVRTYASALRAFFRYAEVRGWCRRGLTDSIRGPRVFAHEGLPSAPCWDDVRRLLAATSGDTPIAIRDHAIVALIAAYGCRAGEVIRLRLDDLDWDQDLLHLTRLKPLRTQTYPLSQPVGDALIRYLKEARPKSAHREVFLRQRPPFAPLTSSALWWVVGHRLRALGVALRHHGPHALRHACATHLLGEGFTLKEIGDHLGHRSPEATRVYAKVDLVALRAVADFDLGGLP